MSTIDRKVVEMQFDNAQFEKNVKGSMSTLEKLKSALNFNGLTKGFDDIDKQSKKVTFSDMNKGLQTVGKSFNALEEIARGALRKIGEDAMQWGKKIVSSLSIEQIASGWDKYGKKTNAVGTLIAQGYDMSEVEKELSKLNWYTDETSAEFTEMVSSIAKFTAAGKTLPEATTALMGISNWAYLSGQNAQTAARAMYQLSQAMGKGVFRLDDYKSIQNASMDTMEFRQRALDAAVALGTLEKQSDGSYKSLVKGANKSKFTITQFTDSLTKGAWFTSDVMMKVYGEYGAAIDMIFEKAKDSEMSASAVIEQISDEMHEKLGDDLADFAIKAFKAAQEARTWGDAVDSVKEALATQWSGIYEAIFGNYEEAKELFTDLSETFYDSFVTPISKVRDTLTEGLKGIDPFKEGYLAENYGIPEDVYQDWMKLGETVGFTNDKTREFLNLHSDLSKESQNVLSHWLQLHSEAGEAQSEFVGMSKATFAETSAGILGITNEQATALKATADEYGSNSYKFRSELKKVFGDGKLGMMELATSMYAVGDGIDHITTKDLSDYLKNSIKLTDDQVSELYKLSDQYGATSKQVDDYLKSLGNLKGYGMANKSYTRQGIENLLELSDAFRKAEKAQQDYQTGDVVTYIQSITGANKEQVESLWELYNAEAETEDQAERNQKKMDELVKSISKGDEATGELVKSIMELEKETDALTGRQNLIDAFNTAWEGLSEILGSVKDAFDEVFGVLDSKGVYSFTQRIKDMAAKLKLADDQLDKIKRTFKGVFSIFKMVGQFVDAALIPIRTLFNLITGGKKSILDITASWGDFLDNMAQTNAVGKAVTPFFEKIAEKIKVIYPVIENFIKKIKGIKEAITKTFEENGGGLSGVFAVIKEAIGGVIDSALELIGTFTGWDVSQVKQNVLEFLDTMWNRVKNILPDQKKLEEAFDNIKESAKKALKFLGIGGGDEVKSDAEEGEKGVDIVSQSVEKLSGGFEKLAGFVTTAKDGIAGFFKNISDGAEAFKNSKIGQNVIEFFSGLKDGLDGLQLGDILEMSALVGGLLLIRDIVWSVQGIVKNLPFQGLKVAFTTMADGFKQMGIAVKRLAIGFNILAFAGAILMIVSALGMLTKMDKNQIGTALGILTYMVGGLIGVMELMEHTMKGGNGSKAATNLLKFSVSLLLVTNVISKLVEIAKTNPDELWEAVGIISILEIVMAGCTWILSKSGSKGKVSGAVSMIVMVIAIKGVVEQVIALAQAGSSSDIMAAAQVIMELIVVMGVLTALFGIIGDRGGSGTLTGMIGGALAMGIMVLAVKGIAEAVGALANSGADLDKMKAAGEIIKSIVTVLGVIAVAIAAIVAVTSGVSKNTTKIKNTTGDISAVAKAFNDNTVNVKLGFETKILALGAAFVMVAAGVWVIAQAIKDVVAASKEGQFGAAVGILGAFFIGIGILVGLFGALKVDVGSVMAGAGAMAIIAGSLWIVAQVIKVMASIAHEDMAALIVASSMLAILTGVIGGLVVLFAYANGNAKSMLTAAATFAIISGSLIAVSSAVALLAQVGAQDLGALIASGLVIGTLAGVVGGLVVLFGYANGNAKTMLMGATSFAIMSGSLIAISAAVAILAQIGGQDIGALIAAAGVIAVLTGVVGGLVVLFGTVGNGGAMVAGAGAFALLAVGIDLLCASLIILAVGINMLGSALENNAGKITKGLHEILSGISSVMAHAVLLVVEFLADLVTGLANIIPSLKDPVVTIVVTIVDILCEATKASYTKILDTFLTLILDTLKALQQSLPQIVSLVINLVISVLSELAAHTEEFVKVVMDFIIGIIKGVAAKLPDLLGAVGELLSGLLHGIIEMVNQMDLGGLDGLLNAIGQLSLIMLALTGLAVLTAGAMLGVLGLASVVGVFALCLILIGGLLSIPGVSDFVSNGMQLTSSIGATIQGFVVAFTDLALMAVLAPLALPGVIAMGVTLTALTVVFGIIGIVAALPFDDAFTLTASISESVIGFTAAFTALALMGALAPLALAGAISMEAAVLALFPLLAAIGGVVSLLPGLSSFVEEGAKILGDIGFAIGNFVGSLVAGTMEGIAQLPQMGQQLSEFMDKVSGFVAGAQGIKGDVVTGIGNLIASIALIAAGEFLSSITSFLGMGDVWGSFAGHLVVLAAGLAAYGAIISLIDLAAVNQSIAAIEAVVTISERLNASQSIIDFIIGKDSFGDFGANLASFAGGLLAFGMSAALVAPYAPAMILAALAITPTVDIAMRLQENQSVLGYIFGQTALADFGKNLAAFAAGLLAFGIASLALAPFAGAMIIVAMAIGPTVDIAMRLQESKSFLDYIFGQTALADFGKNLAAFAQGLLAFGIASLALMPFAGAMIIVAMAIGPTVDIAMRLQESKSFMDYIFGQTALADFGQNLAAFAQGLLVFGMAALALAPFAGAMIIVAMAIGPTVAIAQELESSKTFINYIFGQTALAEFGRNLAAFAAGLLAFGMASMLVAPYAGAMVLAVIATKPAMEMAEELEGQKTFLNYIFGQTALADFGTNLAGFAKGLVRFGTSCRLVSQYSGDMSEVLAAIEPAIEMSHKLKEDEDLLTFIFGQTSLEKFGENLAGLGKGLQKFSDSIADANFTNIRQAVAAITTIASVETSSGDGANIKSLGENFKTAATDIDAAIKKLKDAKELDKAIANLNKVIGLNDSVKSVDKINALADALYKLATTGVANFISEFEEGQSDLATAVSGFIDAAITSVNSKEESFKSALVLIIENASLKSEQTVNDKFKKLGSKIITEIVAGINEVGESIQTALDTHITNARSEADKFYSKFRSTGSYLVSGFINGMNSQINAVITKATEVGSAAANALAKSIDVNSPSKVAFGIGSYFGEGFVNGVSEFVDAADETASELGNSAVDGIRHAIDEASSMVMDTNADVTIRPVLDLSEIQNGVGQIDGLMSRFNGYSVSGTASLASRVAVGSGKASAFDEQSEMSKLTDSIKDLISNQGSTQNNTFNINGASDPEEVAERVAQILAQQIKRRDALWA